jgi:hypothetical protein
MLWQKCKITGSILLTGGSTDKTHFTHLALGDKVAMTCLKGLY